MADAADGAVADGAAAGVVDCPPDCAAADVAVSAAVGTISVTLCDRS